MMGKVIQLFPQKNKLSIQSDGCIVPTNRNGHTENHLEKAMNAIKKIDLLMAELKKLEVDNTHKHEV
jgi:hypothetical protein